MARGSKDRELMGWRCWTSTFNSGHRDEHLGYATKKRRFAPRVDALGSNGADVGRDGPSRMFAHQRTGLRLDQSPTKAKCILSSFAASVFRRADRSVDWNVGVVG